MSYKQKKYFIERDIKRRFDNAAFAFNKNDFIYRHCSNELIERLKPISIQSKNILDLGSATCVMNKYFINSYKGCNLINLDLSHKTLKIAKKNQKFSSNVFGLQANAYKIPLKANSMDIVFSNMLLPWINDIDALFHEVRRILKNNGLFIFSTLGPKSFVTLTQAWEKEDEYKHINPLFHADTITTALHKSGLLDAVLDVDYLNITYQNIAKLYRDITAMGARNCMRDRVPSLIGKNKFNRVINKLRNNTQDRIEINLQIIFGHAWSIARSNTNQEYYLDISQIKKRQ